MRSISLIVFLTFSFFIAVNLQSSDHFGSAQINELGNNGSKNDTLLFRPNNNMSTGTPSNTTGIMENTSGMIDDAFDALKDSFGSFFGK